MNGPSDVAAPHLAAYALDGARRAQFWAALPDALFDRPTIAAVRFCTVQSLEVEAIKGGGTPYRRIGRRAYYRKSDVLAWLEAGSSIVENTAQAAASSTKLKAPAKAEPR